MLGSPPAPAHELPRAHFIPDQATHAEIERVMQIWKTCRSRSAGPDSPADDRALHLTTTSRDEGFGLPPGDQGGYDPFMSGMRSCPQAHSELVRRRFFDPGFGGRLAGTSVF